MLRTFRSLILAAAIALIGAPALASQGSCVMPTVGTVSGLTLVQDINACNGAILSLYSGATAPSSPTTGMLWYNMTANAVQQYDGSNWNTLWFVDASNHLVNIPIGGGTATVASATTTDLCSVPQNTLTISGTTTITGFSNTCVVGTLKPLIFSGILTLTHNGTSLILPNGGSNITTAAGDRAWAAYLGGGNWEVISYIKADGTALSTSSIFTGAIFFDGPISPAALAGNTNDWAPTGLSTANVIRFSCSSAINITGLTAPATDGKIIVLDNIGTSNACTLSPESASSTAANRFSLTFPIIVYPLQSVTLKYDATSSRWRLATSRIAQPISGGFRALKMVNGGTPNNQMTITADALTIEDSTGLAQRLASVSVTPDVTASGANGLDSGSVTTSQWYSTWVIAKPDGTVAGLFSTSATSPTMPAGYTFKVRTGWALTDGSSHFYRLIQYGRTVQYVVGTNPASTLIISSGTVGTYSVTAPTLSAVSVAAYVPSTAAKAILIPYVGWKNGTPGTAELAPNVNWGGSNNGPNGTNGNTYPWYNNGTNSTGGPVIMNLEATTVAWASSGTQTALGILGWEDNL